LLFGTVLAFIFLASFLFAGFLADWEQTQEIFLENSPESNFWQAFWFNLGDSFWELLILVVLICVFVYWIYRRTDWLLVRYKNWLVLGVFLLVVILGSIGSLAEKKHFEPIQQNLERTIYRPDRKNKLSKIMQNKQIFVGKILEINPESGFIKVVNPEEVRIFWFKLANSAPPILENSQISMSDGLFMENLPSPKGQQNPRKSQNPMERPKIPIGEFQIGQRVLIRYEMEKSEENRLILVRIRNF
jgi:hypothetical protein